MSAVPPWADPVCLYPRPTRYMKCRAKRVHAPSLHPLFTRLVHAARSPFTQRGSRPSSTQFCNVHALCSRIYRPVHAHRSRIRATVHAHRSLVHAFTRSPVHAFTRTAALTVGVSVIGMPRRRRESSSRFDCEVAAAAAVRRQASARCCSVVGRHGARQRRQQPTRGVPRSRECSRADTAGRVQGQQSPPRAAGAAGAEAAAPDALTLALALVVVALALPLIPPF